ncbi:zf-TFIIB domain-containing protein [Naasia lichenicola]|uniref:Transcription factor zinc-finger domain-containing protein n=1 Tax=Naasia lichenicola TaxID=2565933 RepID=A0A4S4FLG8_9MICO|nr:zf-TFIIB domain-containing protein [Naasia lichenicola]THG31038.1 hypothetical protein E6C64_10600 [Naasia lichenicola]
MQCPNDSSMLVMSERSGVEIDYCPQCRGVWLDRGELDKIVERAAAEQGPGRDNLGRSRNDDGYRSGHDGGHSGNRQGEHSTGRSGRRKEGWLGDIFG